MSKMKVVFNFIFLFQVSLKRERIKAVRSTGRASGNPPRLVLQAFVAVLLSASGITAYSQQSPTMAPRPPESPSAAAKEKPPDAAPLPPPTDLDQVRQQLQQALAQIEELRAQMEVMRNLITQKKVEAPNNNTVTASLGLAPEVAPDQSRPVAQSSGAQSAVDELIPAKNKGGQFSGAQGLIRSDRLKIGGYVDFRYTTRSLDDAFETRENVDEENPGLTDTTNFKRSGFIMPRAVLGIAGVITPRLLFNSEIEFEFSGKETEIEQMYLEYRLIPQFNLRGGVVVPPLGRFNLFHDANLQDIAPRPLVSTFVIPSTYKDAGIGALGDFRIGNQARLSYEAYVVNGLRSDEGGEFSRGAGLFESKGNNRFFDNNPQKSVVGRVVFSPTLGVELGASGYRGKHDNQGQHNLSIWALDWRLAHRGLQIIGEFARASVQRAPEDEAELAARQFVLSLPKGDYKNSFDFIDANINVPLFDNPARSLGGFYVEARYRFRPEWLTSHFEADDASIAPVLRFDQVNLDRSFPGFSFPLNMRRTSFGVSLRPSEAASINLVYHVDARPKKFLRLPDGRPFPPYFTNLGINGLSLGMVWAF